MEPCLCLLSSAVRLLCHVITELENYFRKPHCVPGPALLPFDSLLAAQFAYFQESL